VADVLHGAALARDRLGAVPDLEVLDEELGGRRAVGDRDLGLAGGCHGHDATRASQDLELAATLT
jgi:hypothetical protein